MKYAPNTSEDVECSFSMYKNILPNNRVNLTTANLGKYMVKNYFFKFKLIYAIIV